MVMVAEVWSYELLSLAQLSPSLFLTILFLGLTLTARPRLGFMDWQKELLVCQEEKKEMQGLVLLLSLCLLLNVRDKCPPAGHQDRETLTVLVTGCAV